MRLRTFTATSITEAMRQVREVLGEDAIILSTEQQGAAVTLTAAIDPSSFGVAGPQRARNASRRAIALQPIRSTPSPRPCTITACRSTWRSA